MKRLTRVVLAGSAAAASLVGGMTAFQGAQAVAGPIRVCTDPLPNGDPQPLNSLVEACVNADPSVDTVPSANSAESVTVNFFGTAYPVCVGRIKVNESPGKPVEYDPRLVYRCY